MPLSPECGREGLSVAAVRTGTVLSATVPVGRHGRPGGRPRGGPGRKRPDLASAGCACRGRSWGGLESVFPSGPSETAAEECGGHFHHLEGKIDQLEFPVELGPGWVFILCLRAFGGGWPGAGPNRVGWSRRGGAMFHGCWVQPIASTAARSRSASTSR